MPNHTKNSVPPNTSTRRTSSAPEEARPAQTVRQRETKAPVGKPLEPYPRPEQFAEPPPRPMAVPYKRATTQQSVAPVQRSDRLVAQPYQQRQKKQNDQTLRRFVDDSPVGWLRFCAQRVAWVIHPAFEATVIVINFLLQVVWSILQVVAPFLSNDSRRRIQRMSSPMLHQDSPAAMLVFAGLILLITGVVTKPFLLPAAYDPRSFEYSTRPVWQRIADPSRAINIFENALGVVAGVLPKPNAEPVVPVPVLTKRALGDHNLQGAPTISPAQIDGILASYGSPATGTGQIWYALGEKYNIDPAYAVAFFIHESSAGTNPAWAGWKDYGSGANTHNVGNIICAGYPTCYGRFRDYPSWEAGIDDWYRLISVEYIQGRGTVTVAQIIPIYAPSFENNVDAYVGAVEEMVDTWRTQGTP